MRSKVECYAGYTGEETPRRFEIEGHHVEVVDVIDRWLGPDDRFFKVRGQNRAVYLLRHDELADSWDVTRLEDDDEPRHQDDAEDR